MQSLGLILKTRSRPTNTAIKGLQRFDIWNDLNAHYIERFERTPDLIRGIERFELSLPLMVSSNPRVGEIKLEEIVDRSIVRKLDDSGFIDRLYSVYPAK